VSGQLHTPAPLPRYPLDRRLGGPQSRSGRRGEGKILDPTGTRTPTLRSSSPQPVAIPTELSRLQYLRDILALFLVSWGGVRLSPLGTSVTNWPIVPAPDDRWSIWRSRWNENWQGKPKCSEETCPNATLSTTNPTWRKLGSNPGSRRLTAWAMTRPSNRSRSRAECLGVPYAERQYLCLGLFNNGLPATSITEHRIGILSVFFTLWTRLKTCFIIFLILHDLLAFFPVMFCNSHMLWYLDALPIVSILKWGNINSSVLLLTPAVV
jgi:hypothetical protein